MPLNRPHFLPLFLTLLASTAWAQNTPASVDPSSASSLFAPGSKFKPNWSVTLSENDWTLDFTVIGRDDFEIIVSDNFGVKGNEWFRFDENDLPVRFFRFYWDSQRRRMWGWENGHEIYRTSIDITSSPNGLLRWGSVSKAPERRSYSADVVLREGPPVDLPRPNAPQPPGLAEKGWTSGAAAPLTPATITVLESLTANNESNLTGCYALAALLIARRNPKTEISPQQLALVDELVAASIDTQKPGGDSSGAAVLLPVTVASMTAAQRAREAPRIEAWKSAFFAPFHLLVASDKPSPVRNPQSGRSAVISRGALLSPAQAIATQDIGRDNIPYFLSMDWLWQVLESRPDAALSQATYLIRNNEGPAFAWFLPQLALSSPKLYREIMDLQRRDPKTAQLVHNGFDSISEETAAKAAYRLVATQPEDAAFFLNLIQDAETRADVLEVFAEKSGQFSPPIDQALADAVAKFKSSRRNDSPVPLLTRRAAYNYRFGRPAIAQGFLTTAMASVGKLKETNFRDTWAIYRLLRDQKDPRAPLWLDKSKAAAIERDSAADEFTGDVYISATDFVVTEMLVQGKTDEALDLARTLNEDDLGTSRALALGRVAIRIARTDLNRALKVVEEIQNERHESTMVNIAVAHAKTNFTAAWKLFETLSDGAQNRSIFRIAALAPDDFSEAVTERIRLAVEAHLGRPQHLKYGLTERDIKGLAELPPSMLAQLASSFKADRLLLARDLFLSIGRTTGLDDDPVWKRLEVSEISHGYSIPWSPDKLTYVFNSERSNAEMGIGLKESS